MRTLLALARWLTCLLLCFGALPSTASVAADLQSLAVEATWLKLGHYQRNGSATSGWRSAIHDDSFFLAAGGRDDPVAELAATLEAFAVPVGTDADAHAKCRFPARWAWLRNQLGPSRPGLDRPMECPGYKAWTRAHSVSSVSIVFATGFLGNPASFYGHTLLKFNFRGAAEHSRLLDVSVNYGAIVSKDEGILTYIVKSVLGGYDGGFSHINFYFHNHNYGDIELRDMWEYQLRLPQEAVDRIVGHAWEVLGKRYTYYFFRENCAFRMAELIEVVDGVDITPRTWPWIIPQALVGHMGAARYQGQPLVDKVVHHPSRQSRFYDKYARLDPAQAEALKSFVDATPAQRGPVLSGLEVQSQQQILETALDYYQYIGAPIDRADKPMREDYTQALSMRYRLPPSQDTKPVPAPSALSRSPHLSRKLGWVQVSGVRQRAAGSGIDLRVRPAYYDALDSESGQVANSQLSMGDLQVSIGDGRIRLRRFDLLGIESVNPGQTPLKGDGGLAYKVHFGAEPARVDCDSCTVVRLQGDYGLGHLLTPDLFVAGYVGGALQSCHADECTGFLRGTLDLIYRPREDLGLRASVERRAFPGRDRLRYTTTRFEGRWRLQANSDLRISVERDRSTRLAVGAGQYW